MLLRTRRTPGLLLPLLLAVRRLCSAALPTVALVTARLLLLLKALQ